MILVTDGSVNPQSGIGFGAYLAFSNELAVKEELVGLVKARRFENTSSTRLELQTLLWALSEMPEKKVVIYTDSQNIVGLLARRERLIASDFCSKSGRKMRNHDLYREFFESTEKFDIQFRLISGHKRSQEKDRIDEIFSIVDKSSRSALRCYIKDKHQPVTGSDNTS